jgi:hypothetical protein
VYEKLYYTTPEFGDFEGRNQPLKADFAHPIIISAR